MTTRVTADNADWSRVRDGTGSSTNPDSPYTNTSLKQLAASWGLSQSGDKSALLTRLEPYRPKDSTEDNAPSKPVPSVTTRSSPKIRQPKTDTGYIFFFGAKTDLVSNPNVIYSQWYPKSFIGDQGVYDLYDGDPIGMKQFEDFVLGKTFVNREQWMMLHKALIFNDIESAEKIMRFTSPKTIKGLGRKVKNFDDKVWNDWKYQLVVNGNYLQFTQDQEMKDRLLSTEDKEIVEASPYDRVWGIGYSADKALNVSKDRWGQNLLGKALMEVREAIRSK